MDMPADEIYEKVMRSGILEQGIEQGLKQGLKQGKSQKEEDNVKSLSEFGMDAKEISKH